MRELPMLGAPAHASERRHPDWIRSKVPGGERYRDLKVLMREARLNTVCEEARCPNIGECWGHKTATFMLLGAMIVVDDRRSFDPEALLAHARDRLANYKRPKTLEVWDALPKSAANKILEAGNVA